jgi:hypothetical protein
MLTLLSVFILDWWFSQWTIWITPIAAILGAKDVRFLMLWSALNVALLANLLINAPYNLDGAMLMPVFGQSVRPLPIYGNLFVYQSILPSPAVELAFMICIALFVALGIRSSQWLVSRSSIHRGLKSLRPAPGVRLAVALVGPIAMIPYVGAMVAQHVLQ